MNTSPRRRLDMAGLVIAIILFALAGLIWWDMSTLGISSVYGPGPKAMPIIVAGGVVLMAIGNLVMAITGSFPARESLDWRPIFLILGSLIILILLVRFGGGFILGSALLFAATAAAFGRRAFLMDLLIGLVIGVFVHILFSKLLTLSLPTGPLERLL
jgi:putative tricarboxylic transport membrane protein